MVLIDCLWMPAPFGTVFTPTRSHPRIRNTWHIRGRLPVLSVRCPPGPQSSGSNRSCFGVSNDTQIMFWRRQQRVDVSIATFTHALKDGAFARGCPGNGATRHAHDTLRIPLCSPTHGATARTQCWPPMYMPWALPGHDFHAQAVTRFFSREYLANQTCSCQSDGT